MRRVTPLLPALLLALIATACEGTTEPALPAASGGAPQTIGVRVTPNPARTMTSGTVTFAAAVTGTANLTTTWSVVEVNGGTVTQAGVYSAPGAPGTFRVRATSAADTRVFGEATVTVDPPPAPVAVSLSPTTAAVDACRTLDFTAAVANAANPAVTWEVQEGAVGGTISATGRYTAPDAAGVYHVVARSVADTTKTAVAQVTVNDHVLAVAVTPSTGRAQVGGQLQFTATVTTTCGSYAASAAP